MTDGFFNRWSRRKHEAATGRSRPAPESTAPETPSNPAQESLPGAQAAAAGVAPASDEPLPTLEDVQSLEPSSNFQPFMRRGVTQDVRNAAMKKLFADPHFNVMDGLDIYIGDYTQPDPLPVGMLEQMAGAQFLNLVQVPQAAGASDRLHGGTEENPDQNPQAQQGAAVVAQSPDSAVPMTATNTDHDHTDLQLQPDPAAADPQAGSGPR